MCDVNRVLVSKAEIKSSMSVLDAYVGWAALTAGSGLSPAQTEYGCGGSVTDLTDASDEEFELDVVDSSAMTDGLREVGVRISCMPG